jgi:ADP-ribose pyrophosphatase YjhB (NUDIX family)
VGVGAVIVTADRAVVLVRRRLEPMAGSWSLPGGVVEVGEPLAAAVAREVREETNLDVEVGPIVDVNDRIFADDDGRVRHHYVLVDYLCQVRGGRLEAGTDAAEVIAVSPDALGSYDLPDETLRVIARGVALEGPQ